MPQGRDSLACPSREKSLFSAGPVRQVRHFENLTMPGEFDFIQWIRTRSPATAVVQIPPGDDLAALKWDPSDLLLVGVDQVLDGVHFDSAVHSPRNIGHKAMNRNLSDCAAMACLPVAALASVALPGGAGVEYAKELYGGLRAAADPFDCAIVGGDTGAWAGKLALSVTILGAAPGSRRQRAAAPSLETRSTSPAPWAAASAAGTCASCRASTWRGSWPRTGASPP